MRLYHVSSPRFDQPTGRVLPVMMGSGKKRTDTSDTTYTISMHANQRQLTPGSRIHYIIKPGTPT